MPLPWKHVQQQGRVNRIAQKLADRHPKHTGPKGHLQPTSDRTQRIANTWQEG